VKATASTSAAVNKAYIKTIHTDTWALSLPIHKQAKQIP